MHGDSAVQSGIKQLALVISVSLVTFASTASTAKVGYTNPFLIAETVLSTVGAGLLYTWNPETTLDKLCVVSCVPRMDSG